MRMITKMQLLKLEQEQEVWKPHFSVQIYLECMRKFVLKKNGKLKLLVFQKVKPEV